MAFPFVYAAIAMVAHRSAGDWVGTWFLADVVGRVAIGVAVGWAIGKVLGRLSFDPPGRLVALSDAQDGFVALAVTFIAYGVTELAHGYGFLAVFTAAVALRDSERGHSYHRVLHDFAGQVEQLVVVGLLILLGGAAATGLLSDLTWSGALIGLALIFVIRPVSGHLGSDRIADDQAGTSRHQLLRHSRCRVDLLPGVRGRAGRLRTVRRGVGDRDVHHPRLDRDPRRDRDTGDGVPRPAPRTSPRSHRVGARVVARPSPGPFEPAIEI